MNILIDKNVLIELIHNEPSLWNMKSIEYKNSGKMKDGIWLKIARGLGFRIDPIEKPEFSKRIIEKIKKEWKYLRDYFSKEYKEKRLEHKSGDENDGFEDYFGQWEYFEKLTFLKNTIKPKPSSGNLDNYNTKTTSADYIQHDHDYLYNNILDRVDNTVTTIDLKTQEGSFGDYASSTVIPQKSIKLHSENSDSAKKSLKRRRSEDIEMEERKLKIFESKNKLDKIENDSIHHFLKGLYSHLKKSKNLLKMQCGIMNFINNQLDSEEQELE